MQPMIDSRPLLLAIIAGVITNTWQTIDAKRHHHHRQQYYPQNYNHNYYQQQNYQQNYYRHQQQNHYQQQQTSIDSPPIRTPQHDSSYNNQTVKQEPSKPDNSSLEQQPVPQSTRGLVPTAYVVELTAQPGTNEAVAQQQEFFRQAEKVLSLVPRATYNRLMNAVAFNILKGGEWYLQRLATLPMVKAIEPLEKGLKHSNILNASGNEAIQLRRRQSVDTNKDFEAGRGVKIGIIDTGIDYLHSALGGCFGKGCKVTYGYDFVGDNYNGANMPHPDADPMDSCNGHGTHVAGIIAAQSSYVIGVAPAATLGAYRVFGCEGTVTTDVLMSAMERAFVDGMDIVNISIGSRRYFVNVFDARMAQALVNLGVVVVASAGNSGDLDMFSVTSPGTAPGVISVGSINPEKSNVFFFTELQTKEQFTYITAKVMSIPPSTTSNITTTGFDNAEACRPLSQSYKHKFLLVDRGQCTFEIKAQHASKAGAIGLIIANNGESLQEPDISTGIKIPVLMVLQSTGKRLKSLLTKPGNNQTLKVKWNLSPTNEHVAREWGWSSFSSYGPSASMKGFKPEVVAYGVKIFSTYPTQLGSYAIRTGTSMSAPYVAGTAALILQRSVAGVPFKQRPTAVRRILTQTADPQVWQQHLTSNELSDRVLPPLHCGSGLARADATSEATWGFDVEGITIYPDQYNRPTMFNATNVAFTGHVPQGTIKFRLELAPSISNWVMGHPQNGLATSTINIWDMYSITPSTLNIGPGTSNISVNTPTKYIFNLILGSQSISPNIDTLWIHSGFIVAEHIAASNGRKTVRRIPFQSILGAKYNINPIQKTNNYPKLDKFNGAALLPETAPAIINGKPLSVALRFRLLTPTQQLFALVEDAASNRTLGMVPGSKSFNVDAQDNIKDSDFLLTWNGAIQISNPSNPKQSKIAPVPDGKYRVRLFVLRPGLNATNQLNYDTWLTPIITVSGIVAKAQTQNTAAIVNENAGTINSVVPKIQTMSVFLHNNLN